MSPRPRRLPGPPSRLVSFCSAAGLWLTAGAAPAAPGAPDYFAHIRPLLSVHCYKCHDAETRKGGLRLDLRAAAQAGGRSKQPVLTADGELLRRVRSTDPDEQMPPEGPRLTEDEVASLARWLEAGAPWPDRDEYWAFRPPREVTPPPGPAAHPVDRFLDARLAAAGLAPGPPADARTLLRRAYFGLLGVPPTPEEAEAYLAEARGDPQSAFGRLLDRLLADPRYGERWARHWLDLARYGESDGYEDDKVRPHAWRYRDYVIRAFNADKPYDRFLMEQIAGDELWPGDPDAWIATGFARLGAWDGMSKEPEQQRQDFLNDATDTAGAAFLGVTLGCARCHDHKYDAITQRDYFAMQAFFAGVKRETRGLPAPPAEPAAVTAAFQAGEAELGRLRVERDGLLQAARAALEQAQAGRPEHGKIEDGDVRKRVEQDHPGRLAELEGALRALEPRVRLHAPQAEVVSRGDGPRPVRLLRGGELGRPGEEVAPGFIAAMLPAAGQGQAAAGPAVQGRADLGRWLASPEHPLTARVLVNRVWQHHFGAGLVATPSDFGRNGRPPTHPELLDWLARRFAADGWSLKRLHRLILTSAAYRRASHAGPAAAYERDPENRLLWRAHRRRLEGEAIRDTILAVSGALEPSAGGPGVYARLPRDVNVEFPNNDKELSWGEATEEENRRRSVYLFQRRTLTFPLLEVFDAAPMNQPCAVRAQTTVAPQALALFNGEFAREAAGHFAARLRREAGGDPARQAARAFQIAFQRPPTGEELVWSVDFLARQAALRDGAGDALTDFCHALLNANELIHVD